MAKELNDATMRENAAGPAEVSGDAGSMKQHSPRDQIEADRYLNSKQAALPPQFIPPPSPSPRHSAEHPLLFYKQ